MADMSYVLWPVAIVCCLCATVPCCTNAEDKNCDPDWEENMDGEYCYRFNLEVLNWMDADLQCKNWGGQLMSLHSLDESLHITGRAKGFSQPNYWLGGKYEDKTWKWSDGSPYNFLNWRKGRPAILAGHISLAMPSGRWNNFFHLSLRASICKKLGHRGKKTMPSLPTPPPKISSHQFWGCPRGWSEFRESCYISLFLEGNLDWYDGNRVCRRLQSHLVAISDKEEADFVIKLLPHSDTNTILTGLHWSSERRAFRWSDGQTPVTFLEWKEDSPRDVTQNYNCVSLLVNSGLMVDVECNMESQLVCEQNKKLQDKSQPFAGCENASVAHEGSCYEASQTPKTFTDAEDHCIQHGGHLATVRDSNIQNILSAELNKWPWGSFWIGLNISHGHPQSRTDTESKLLWTSESIVDYIYWDSSETEESSESRLHTETERCASIVHTTGLWHTFNCSHEMYFICEYPRSGWVSPTTSPISATFDVINNRTTDILLPNSTVFGKHRLRSDSQASDLSLALVVGLTGGALGFLAVNVVVTILVMKTFLGQQQQQQPAPAPVSRAVWQ